MDVEIYLPNYLRESPDGSCFSSRAPPGTAAQARKIFCSSCTDLRFVQLREDRVGVPTPFPCRCCCFPCNSYDVALIRYQAIYAGRTPWRY